MKTNIYKFYKEKYDLKRIDLNLTDEKILFLIYDDKYYYYLENNEFITEKEKVDILDKINFLNYKYKLEITNFYPVCYCTNTLVIALKTDMANTTLKKYDEDSLTDKYKKLIKYHKNEDFAFFFTPDVNKEIAMSRKYISRYKFHQNVLKKYIFTEKRRCKKEFRKILYDLLPNKKSLIDVSCGDDSDIFLVAKKKEYETIVGNDICLNYLNLYKKNDIIYTNDNIELNNLKKNSYDVSFCKNTLHHMNSTASIKNALDFLDKISNDIIIIEIMDPKEYKGLPKFLNKYLYTKFLKDAGHCYINEEQFVNIINHNFKNHDIEYRTFVNVLGTYKIAKITKKGGNVNES